MMRNFLLLKTYKIKFTYKKETRPIPIQIFILTQYKKISICNLIYSSLQYLQSPAATVAASTLSCTIVAPVHVQGLPALHPWQVNVRLEYKVLEV